jgi:hypothetical protein
MDKAVHTSTAKDVEAATIVVEVAITLVVGATIATQPQRIMIIRLSRTRPMAQLPMEQGRTRRLESIPNRLHIGPRRPALLMLMLMRIPSLMLQLRYLLQIITRIMRPGSILLLRSTYSMHHIDL